MRAKESRMDKENNKFFQTVEVKMQVSKLNEAEAWVSVCHLSTQCDFPASTLA